MKVYYRRTAVVHPFPATSPDDVQVSFHPQMTGPGDGDWHAAKFDPENIGAEIVDAALASPTELADAFLCDAAILRAWGVPLPLANGPAIYVPFEPDDFDDEKPGAFEALCDAVEILYGEDVAAKQRRMLKDVLSPQYAVEHGIPIENPTEVGKRLGKAIARDTLAYKLPLEWAGFNAEDGDQLSGAGIKLGSPEWEQAEAAAREAYYAAIEEASRG